MRACACFLWWVKRWALIHPGFSATFNIWKIFRKPTLAVTTFSTGLLPRRRPTEVTSFVVRFWAVSLLTFVFAHKGTRSWLWCRLGLPFKPDIQSQSRWSNLSPEASCHACSYERTTHEHIRGPNPQLSSSLQLHCVMLQLIIDWIIVIHFIFTIYLLFNILCSTCTTVASYLTSSLSLWHQWHLAADSGDRCW